MSITARRAAAVATAAILLPSLSGCWSGFGSQTSSQANQAVGNGANMSTGEMEIRGATWVRSTVNPAEATLVATFINNGDTPDRLTKVETEPTSPTGITNGAIEVKPGESARIGFWSKSFVNAFQLNAFPSTFVPTTFTFEGAGTVTGNVMTVPNTGQYSEVVVTVADQQRLLEFVDEAEGVTDTVKKTKKVKEAKQKKAEALG